MDTRLLIGIAVRPRSTDNPNAIDHLTAVVDHATPHIMDLYLDLQAYIENIEETRGRDLRCPVGLQVVIMRGPMPDLLRMDIPHPPVGDVARVAFRSVALDPYTPEPTGPDRIILEVAHNHSEGFARVLSAIGGEYSLGQHALHELQIKLRQVFNDWMRGVLY